MPSDYELNISRYQTFLRDCLDSAVYSGACPLTASMFALTDPKADPMSPEEALKQSFTPVQTGLRWGPKWSTAWFRVTGTVPASLADQHVVLRFSSGTEAQVWEKNASGAWVAAQGLDVNRDALTLTSQAKGGEAVDVLIEAACNHPFGVMGFEWDPAEVVARWNSDQPGRFELCEAAALDTLAWEVKHAYAFALGLIKELSSRNGQGPLQEIAAESSRAMNLYGALRQATTQIEPYLKSLGETQAARESMEAGLTTLTHALKVNASGSTTVCHAVGHAHIDTAWLWPIRETKRKCLRSFSNQLRLMERFPDYVFLCSQAQQYAWVKEQSPELFAQIATRVEEGRWEPGGAMWIEPDANCPSGESLIRQILHGTNFWKREFGQAGNQSFLYLPDTFGFPASLPQIMAHAGLKMFITNKMVWNRSNVFPHTTFVWRGIDGSEVLAHNTPGHDYNAVNTPKELRRGEVNHRNRDRSVSVSEPARWLQPFGYGDGGGGPTDWSIRYAQYAADCDGMPKVMLSRVDEFIEHIERQHALTLGTPEALPTWWGELYLEIHRGTLTSQAWIKEANRRAEEDLRFAEVLAWAGPEAHEDPAQAQAKLDKAWKTVLLNQFHDILPGSSIGWVYEDARRDFARVSKVTDALIEKGTTRWLSHMSTRGVRKPVGVFNPCSVERSGVIELPDGSLAFARHVPALGLRIIDQAHLHGCVPVTIKDRLESDGDIELTNGLITARINEAGQVSYLSRVGLDHEFFQRDDDGAHIPMNQLVLYEDVPHMWDAWDIDPSYEDKAYPVMGEVESIEIICEEPLRCAVRVTRALGAKSRIEQVYTLDAGSSRLDIHSKVQWHESRTMLRALFPTSIMAMNATYDIQMGTLERPTHRNTSWDSAKFEVCAHRWMDLSERGAGLALLNDSKYGHSCHEGTLGISLLRSPKHPDPEADQGEHEFTYSLLPHEGDWRGADVDREAEALNMPLLAYVLNPEEDGTLGTSFSPFTYSCTGTAGIAIDCVKRAEHDDRLILRFHESRGGRGKLSLKLNTLGHKSPAQSGQSIAPGSNTPTPTVQLLDAHEVPLPDQSALSIGAGGEIHITLRPYGIVTLGVK